MADTTYTLTLTIHGFIALTDKLVVSALARFEDGTQRHGYAYIPQFDTRAKHAAADAGVTIGDIADAWNAARDKVQHRHPLTVGTLTLSRETTDYFREMADAFTADLEAKFKDARGMVILLDMPPEP